ncbi:tetratricopeptide repeat protein [Streptomyces griseiscabiei]|uniref:Tetratricopeptide repeat protein n=1 Tax=Streptomyces griseiscabiei TaxID=2993540 RepID=A0ABU4L372_9ACTN|nr:tetratricopeptide repeat protein [Streptomyces griseiscabiei]MBZ3901283.1 tetratricopeptide repeat protein [Streptomyces griseiscabiei]MDX2910166.1 tetratricopeptide repeat protein [Streptomyces griseiscabiei]
MSTEERMLRAEAAYERAVFAGDPSGLGDAERDLDAVEAELALTRGRLLHARFLEERASGASGAPGASGPERWEREGELFRHAADLFRALGDAGGEGRALLWVGIFHQVVRGDDRAAVPVLERARVLASEAGDRLTLSYALRHLGIAEHVAGRLESARDLLEESVQLRREVGFPAGVAANLVGLMYIAAAQGRREDALALAEEASALAGSADATAVVRQVDEARARLWSADPDTGVPHTEV